MPRRIASRWSRRLWAAAAFFAVGYLPVAFLRNPPLAMGLAIGLVIPFGSRAPNVRAGALRGLGLGLIAAVAMMGAIHTMNAQAAERAREVGATQPASAPATAPAAATRPAGVLSAQQLREIDALCLLGTAPPCAGVGALFAFAAQRRRRRIDRQWRAGP
jgi:hypothetical protein